MEAQAAEQLLQHCITCRCGTMGGQAEQCKRSRRAGSKVNSGLAPIACCSTLLRPQHRLPTHALSALLTSSALGTAAVNVYTNERGVHLPAAHAYIEAVEGGEVGVRGRLEHRLLRHAVQCRVIGRVALKDFKTA